MQDEKKTAKYCVGGTPYADIRSVRQAPRIGSLQTRCYDVSTLILRSNRIDQRFLDASLQQPDFQPIPAK